MCRAHTVRRPPSPARDRSCSAAAGKREVNYFLNETGEERERARGRVRDGRVRRLCVSARKSTDVYDRLSVGYAAAATRQPALVLGHGTAVFVSARSPARSGTRGE